MRPETETITRRGAVSDKGLVELFSDFTRETTTLVRQEIDLAKAEIADSAKEVGKDAGLVAGGGITAHIGLLGLVAAAILGLGEAIPYWASALIVGAVLLAIGAGLGLYGQKRLKEVRLAPKRAIESVKKSAIIIKDYETWNPEAH